MSRFIHHPLSLILAKGSNLDLRLGRQAQPTCTGKVHRLEVRWTLRGSRRLSYLPSTFSLSASGCSHSYQANETFTMCAAWHVSVSPPEWLASWECSSCASQSPLRYPVNGPLCLLDSEAHWSVSDPIRTISKTNESLKVSRPLGCRLDLVFRRTYCSLTASWVGRWLTPVSLIVALGSIKITRQWVSISIYVFNPLSPVCLLLWRQSSCCVCWLVQGLQLQYFVFQQVYTFSYHFYIALCHLVDMMGAWALSGMHVIKVIDLAVYVVEETVCIRVHLVELLGRVGLPGLFYRH